MKKTPSETSPLVTITRTDKGVLFEPNRNLMDAFGFARNATFVPSDPKEKAHLVGKLDVAKKRRKSTRHKKQ